MEGNRDESSRCIDIAIEAFNSGNYEKSIKFLHKANSLYPSKTADELLNQIKHHSDGLGSTKSGSKTTKPEFGKENDLNGFSKTSKIETPHYSKEQIEVVKKIKKCKNYYEVLGVSKEATDSEIKKAYKKLALQLHPDKNNAPGAVEAFKSVANAVATLTDPHKRKEYNMYGIAANQNGHNNPFNSSNYSNRNYRNFEYAESDVSAEELFNMFFGGAQRRRGPTYAHNSHTDSANTPSVAFGLILVLILISMLSSFFTSDPSYNLSQTSKYSVKRFTTHLGVPYYVTETFTEDYQGPIPRLESSVEEDYIYTMKQNCHREKSYRESMMARSRSFGSRSQMAQAQGLKMPSCDNLSKLGIKRYTIY